MYLCYIDESGTASIPGNTSHYVLVGISIPIWHWKDCENEIVEIKKRHHLKDAEIHTAWILRPYLEQNKISNFADYNHFDRKSRIQTYRKREILRLQRENNTRHLKQTKKNYRFTDEYIHLTHSERKAFIEDIAQCVSNWGFARMFAECIDKIHFDPTRTSNQVDEQAFEQLVSRFESYLRIMNSTTSHSPAQTYGLLIHDNNQTVAKNHTHLMKSYQKKGTLWGSVNHIIETPLFVDSELTSLVQIADLCTYAIRRYLENNETKLFDLIFERADKKNGATVGVRHFSENTCNCKICSSHSVIPS